MLQTAVQSNYTPVRQRICGRLLIREGDVSSRFKKVDTHRAKGIYGNGVEVKYPTLSRMSLNILSIDFVVLLCRCSHGFQSKY